MYDNFIFDFDGTIVDLSIDWQSLKKELRFILNSFHLQKSKNFYEDIDNLRSSCKIFDLLEKYENEAIFSPKEQTLKMINEIDSFFVISNNLTSTVNKTLTRLNIMQKCIFVVGIDKASQSKPFSNAFNLLKPYLKKGKTLYIGDRLSDKVFAENCGIDFMFAKDI